MQEERSVKVLISQSLREEAERTEIPQETKERLFNKVLKWLKESKKGTIQKEDSEK